MTVTDYTTNRHIPFPTGADLIPEGPAEMEAIATALDGENRGEIDILQAGIVSATDWSFTAAMESSSECKLGSTATVGGIAWLPLTAIGLLRSVTTAAKLSALKPSSLPGSGKYLTVGFELTPSTSNAAATVSVVSGVEQTTQALAESHSPATTAGKARIRDVVILNTAGVYSIAAQRDRRPWARGGLFYVAENLTGNVAMTGTSEVLALEGRPKMQGRVEISGSAPIEVSFSADIEGVPASHYAEFDCVISGAFTKTLSLGNLAPSAGTEGTVSYTALVPVGELTGGSCLFQLTGHLFAATTATVRMATTFIVRELLLGSSNGTS
jgi:hypothetical protein